MLERQGNVFLTGAAGIGKSFLLSLGRGSSYSTSGEYKEQFRESHMRMSMITWISMYPCLKGCISSAFVPIEHFRLKSDRKEWVKQNDLSPKGNWRCFEAFNCREN